MMSMNTFKISLARLTSLLSMHGARMGEDDLNEMFGVKEEGNKRITFPHMLDAVVGPLT